jgi:serine phosphatase RsbU (regulator of sigma subunit)
MRAANDEVSRDNPELFFVTAFAGILDLDSGALAYCNAGHDNPYVLGPTSSVPEVRSGPGPEPETAEVTRLAESDGPPLCTVDGFAYLGGERQLQAGELLCLVTDGVVDAQSPSGERYGGRRLQELLARQPRGSSAHGVVDAIGADLRAFIADAEPADDLTILALRWIGPVAYAAR